MKVILMAAGRGTRISREINDAPKCTLRVGNEPLIRYTVELFLRNNIEVAVVVGFKHDVVADSLKGLPVRFFHNPFYDVTNSIASLWFAKSFWTDGDALLMNADVFIRQDTVNLLTDERRCPMMLVDSSRIKEGDFFFQYKNDVLIKYGKELVLEERTGEYIGIAKLEESFRRKFLGKLDEMISTQQHFKWWENVLYTLSDKGESIYVRDIGGRFWSEIDCIADYQKIQEYCSGKQTHHDC